MKDSIRLVQLHHASEGRKLALVDGNALRFLTGAVSVYELAFESIRTQQTITVLIENQVSDVSVHYDELYEGRSSWKILPSFDHPSNPSACLVSGTGLTHKKSAVNRQNMHTADADKMTDSMKIYQWGLEGGQVMAGTIGVQPEWFYKGTGEMLKAHGEPLEIPPYANDGGEEPEVAGIYVIGQEGQPYRVGFTTGNEFSDHVMESKNYLYLAPSKLRQCAIGPELVIDGDFTDIEGTVSIERNGTVLWSQEVKTGENNMAHSLSNLEYHHFKYAFHRLPGQAHVHFFGADAFSFGKGIPLKNLDTMVVEWNKMGRPLRNPLKMLKEEENYVGVKSLG
ncbi:MAG: AraD1 family protein [Chitinophagaceae bacterium]